jgi:hypothetical protein
MWRDTSYTAGPMKNILVLAVKKNPAHRRIWEDGFIDELAKYGVTATPSYRLFYNDLPDTNDVILAIMANGYDGVLLINRRVTQTTTTHIPGYTTKKPLYSYDPWQNSYFLHYDREYHDGYTDTTKIVQHEVNLWTTKEKGRMIWSGTTEVLDPSSSKQVNDEILNLIIPELATQGIIPVKK